MADPSAYTIKNDVEVLAEQLDEDRSIVTPNGPVHGQAGDWEVVFPDGNVRRMTNDEWEQAQGGSKDEMEAEATPMSTPGNVGSETESDNEKDAASEDSPETGVKDSATDTVTPDEPSRDSRDTPKTDDDRF